MNIKRFGVMLRLDEKKLAKLGTTNRQLDEKYGENGTASVKDSAKRQWHGIMAIYSANAVKN